MESTTHEDLLEEMQSAREVATLESSGPPKVEIFNISETNQSYVSNVATPPTGLSIDKDSLDGTSEEISPLGSDADETSQEIDNREEDVNKQSPSSCLEDVEPLKENDCRAFSGTHEDEDNIINTVRLMSLSSMSSEEVTPAEVEACQPPAVQSSNERVLTVGESVDQSASDDITEQDDNHTQILEAFSRERYDDDLTSLEEDDSVSPDEPAQVDLSTTSIKTAAGSGANGTPGIRRPSMASPVPGKGYENIDRYRITDEEFESLQNFDWSRIRPEIMGDLDFIVHLPQEPALDYEALGPSLPPKSPSVPSKTLFLDLDETLAHTCLDGSPKSRAPDLIFASESDGALAHVYFRPWLDDFLNVLSQYYELVVYTASLKPYADLILDEMDTHKKLSHRLYREHCTQYGETDVYFKDLHGTGRRLEESIVIDNRLVSFGLNIENAIFVSSYTGESEDTEFLQLIPLLIALSRQPDVRPSLNQTYRLRLIVDKLRRENALAISANFNDEILSSEKEPHSYTRDEDDSHSEASPIMGRTSSMIEAVETGIESLQDLSSEQRDMEDSRLTKHTTSDMSDDRVPKEGLGAAPEDWGEQKSSKFEEEGSPHLGHILLSSPLDMNCQMGRPSSAPLKTAVANLGGADAHLHACNYSVHVMAAAQVGKVNVPKARDPPICISLSNSGGSSSSSQGGASLSSEDEDRLVTLGTVTQTTTEEVVPSKGEANIVTEDLGAEGRDGLIVGGAGSGDAASLLITGITEVPTELTSSPSLTYDVANTSSEGGSSLVGIVLEEGMPPYHEGVHSKADILTQDSPPSMVVVDGASSNKDTTDLDRVDVMTTEQIEMLDLDQTRGPSNEVRTTSRRSMRAASSGSGREILSEEELGLQRQRREDTGKPSMIGSSFGGNRRSGSRHIQALQQIGAMGGANVGSSGGGSGVPPSPSLGAALADNSEILLPPIKLLEDRREPASSGSNLSKRSAGPSARRTPVYVGGPNEPSVPFSLALMAARSHVESAGGQSGKRKRCSSAEKLNNNSGEPQNQGTRTPIFTEASSSEKDKVPSKKASLAMVIHDHAEEGIIKLPEMVVIRETTSAPPTHLDLDSSICTSQIKNHMTTRPTPPGKASSQNAPQIRETTTTTTTIEPQLTSSISSTTRQINASPQLQSSATPPIVTPPPYIMTPSPPIRYIGGSGSLPTSLWSSTPIRVSSSTTNRPSAQLVSNLTATNNDRPLSGFTRRFSASSHQVIQQTPPTSISYPHDMPRESVTLQPQAIYSGGYFDRNTRMVDSSGGRTYDAYGGGISSMSRQQSSSYYSNNSRFTQLVQPTYSIEDKFWQGSSSQTPSQLLANFAPIMTHSSGVASPSPMKLMQGTTTTTTTRSNTTTTTNNNTHNPSMLHAVGVPVVSSSITTEAPPNWWVKAINGLTPPLLTAPTQVSSLSRSQFQLPASLPTSPRSAPMMFSSQPSISRSGGDMSAQVLRSISNSGRDVGFTRESSPTTSKLHTQPYVSPSSRILMTESTTNNSSQVIPIRTQHSLYSSSSGVTSPVIYSPLSPSLPQFGYGGSATPNVIPESLSSRPALHQQIRTSAPHAEGSSYAYHDVLGPNLPYCNTAAAAAVGAPPPQRSGGGSFTSLASPRDVVKLNNTSGMIYQSPSSLKTYTRQQGDGYLQPRVRFSTLPISSRLN